MSIIVQKFGGTSVADSEKILAAARKAIRTQKEGHQVVMVVSAMGKNTDMLVKMAAEINDSPPDREMDMLLSTGEQVSVALMAMAIHTLGAQAVSLTGGQIGIRTDSSHTQARIQSISTERMQRLLDEGNIVIAAGFQGIDEDFNITTLGRGGSDTTAVALAAVLGAEACEIYTDVDGVFTTDPRLLPEARKLDHVSHDEMLELASLGAGVMHSRSIEFGKKFNVPIHVRNSGVFTDEPGTIIGPIGELADRAVSGSALTRLEARITVSDILDQPGTMHALFSKLAEQNITVDMIVQNVGAVGRANISYTVIADDLERSLQIALQVVDQLGAGKVSHDQRVSKVSIVGLGMATQTGVADRMFRALATENINIEAISTSQIKISVLVAREQALEALRAVHQEFELDMPADARIKFEDTQRKPSSKDSSAGEEGDRDVGDGDVGDGDEGDGQVTHPNAVDVVSRLQNMEELTVESVARDDSQARVTINRVPDQPGIAAQVFETIAANNIMADMIVQSVGEEGCANISVTVAQKDLERTVQILAELVHQLGGQISHEGNIVILTVTGIGIRSHTGVALRMFQALSEADVNIDMINTSEVRVNVVVASENAEKAYTALQQAFADVIGS
ncbi:MAG: aspartate kinase [Pirellulales bacterium]